MPTQRNALTSATGVIYDSADLIIIINYYRLFVFHPTIGPTHRPPRKRVAIEKKKKIARKRHRESCVRSIGFFEAQIIRREKMEKRNYSSRKRCVCVWWYLQCKGPHKGTPPMGGFWSLVLMPYWTSCVCVLVHFQDIRPFRCEILIIKNYKQIPKWSIKLISKILLIKNDWNIIINFSTVTKVRKFKSHSIMNHRNISIL